MVLDSNLSKKLISKLQKKKIKIFVAESITGGKFTAELVKTKGASEYLDYSLITYSNESKSVFFNIEKIIKINGVISPEVALKMAERVSFNSNCTNKISLACTGLASKTTKYSNIKLGTVFIACCYKKKKKVIKKVFKEQKRSKIISMTVTEMFKLANSLI